MADFDHLPLPEHRQATKKFVPDGRGGKKFSLPPDRNKKLFASKIRDQINQVTSSLKKSSATLDPSLIFEITFNDKNPTIGSFKKFLNDMEIEILSVQENRKGCWVVFSDDQNLKVFLTKLNNYGTEKNEYHHFNIIDAIQDIPVEKKIGKSLKDSPLDDTPDYIDLELWKIDNPHSNDQYINYLKTKYSDNPNFILKDSLITNSFVQLRVLISGSILNEILIDKEISSADRPVFSIFSPSHLESPDIQTIDAYPPHDDATGILILDSGITANHPMLQGVVGAEENFQTKESFVHDNVGHGTSVAGCATFGDIDKCMEEQSFIASNYIYSAKIMYAEEIAPDVFKASYDPERLIGSQLKEAIDSLLSNPSFNIKVINISIGDDRKVIHNNYHRQMPLAALIDELALKYDKVVFIVSSGNKDPRSVFPNISKVLDNYPNYLITRKDYNLIDPATSALSLTVGSISKEIYQQSYYQTTKVITPIAQKDQPSPFTLTGPGVNNMIKPELVEYGGNLSLYEDDNGYIREDFGGKVLLLNNNIMTKPFKHDTGTSYSAPKVAHVIGKLANQYPNKSAIYLKNLILSSAYQPFKPDNDQFYKSIKNTIGHVDFQDNILDSISNQDDHDFILTQYTRVKDDYIYNNDEDFENQTRLRKIFKQLNFTTKLKDNDHLMVSGYGLPSLTESSSSSKNRVVLLHEGEIKLEQTKVFALDFPNEFFEERGNKEITVTLTFNPETRLTRSDSYLGNQMSFYLYEGLNPDELIKKHGTLPEFLSELVLSEKFKLHKIDLLPSLTLRQKSCHQRASVKITNSSRKLRKGPISLVLINNNKWIKDLNKKQNYCISVTFKHEKEIDLYSQIQAKIRSKTKIKIK
ncbi:MAG: S8 family peptidase [Candidatus Cloacimonetes bacterium]|nr:S8 family peptidase [Candidatus Cloacimonadota bacterium]